MCVCVCVSKTHHLGLDFGLQPIGQVRADVEMAEFGLNGHAHGQQRIFELARCFGVFQPLDAPAQQHANK